MDLATMVESIARINLRSHIFEAFQVLPGLTGRNPIARGETKVDSTHLQSVPLNSSKKGPRMFLASLRRFRENQPPPQHRHKYTPTHPHTHTHTHTLARDPGNQRATLKHGYCSKFCGDSSSYIKDSWRIQVPFGSTFGTILHLCPCVFGSTFGIICCPRLHCRLQVVYALFFWC